MVERWKDDGGREDGVRVGGQVVAGNCRGGGK